MRTSPDAKMIVFGPPRVIFADEVSDEELVGERQAVVGAEPLVGNAVPTLGAHGEGKNMVMSDRVSDAGIGVNRGKEIGRFIMLWSWPPHHCSLNKSPAEGDRRRPGGGSAGADFLAVV